MLEDFNKILTFIKKTKHYFKTMVVVSSPGKMSPHLIFCSHKLLDFTTVYNFLIAYFN